MQRRSLFKGLLAIVGGAAAAATLPSPAAVASLKNDASAVLPNGNYYVGAHAHSLTVESLPPHTHSITVRGI